MLKIYIPTTHRARQTTYHNLPTPLQRRVIFMTRDDNPYTSELPAERVLIAPHGISRTRQAIAEHAGNQKFVMLDDDLKFAVRTAHDPTHATSATPHDVMEMFAALEAALSTYAHVGVLNREGFHTTPLPHSENTRLLRIYGYNGKVLRRRSLEWLDDPEMVMDDFYMTLKLLTHGYANLCLGTWLHDQGSSNAAGGASTYRTLETHKTSAEKLRQHYPEFVTLVQKETKVAWNGQPRTDVRIAWKKAYAHGVATHGGQLV